MRSARCAIALFVGLACVRAEPPPVDARRWTTQSADGTLVAALYPERSDTRIRALQDWVLQVRTREGEALHPAQFRIGGGMPSHGHGLPTAPRTTTHLGDGRYRIEGMEFNMSGQWLIVVTVQSPRGRHELRFELELPP